MSVVAEINPHAAEKRHAQGWVDELHNDLDELIPAIRKAVAEKRTVSMAYVGNVCRFVGALGCGGDSRRLG